VQTKTAIDTASVKNEAWFYQLCKWRWRRTIA